MLSTETYSFSIHAHAEIKDCLHELGFAIVRQAISMATVLQLRAASLRCAEASGLNKEWGSRTCMNFVEHAPEALLLLEDQAYMELIQALHGTEDLCFSRSACIARKGGNAEAVVRWHTDQCKLSPEQPSRSANDVLNRPHPNYDGFSGWFYLTGSRPSHGGIYVVEGSHKADWKLPEGFRPSLCGRSFNRVGGPDEWYDKFDMPGMVPVITEPNDLILFAANTYHGAAANMETEVRLSCGVGLRPQKAVIDCPWQWPESAHALKARLPQKYQRYLEGYTSIVADWTPES